MSFTLPTLPTADQTLDAVRNPLLTLLDIEQTMGWPSTAGAEQELVRMRTYIKGGQLPTPHHIRHGRPLWYTSALWSLFGGGELSSPPVALTAYNEWPRLDRSGELYLPSITVRTPLPLTVLNRYLAGTGFPLLPTPGSFLNRCTDDSPEHLVRLRRTAAFAEASQLIPIRLFNASPLALLIPMFSACGLATTWIDNGGRHFLLLEPYADLSSDFKRFRSWGMEVIEVPEPLAPFCGGWDPTPGAKPDSRSYLVTSRNIDNEFDDDYRYTDDLRARLERAAAGAPAWNDTVGVKS